MTRNADDEQPALRNGVVILGCAALSGTIGGAVIGAVVMVLAAVVDHTAAGLMVAALFAAAVGGVVGLVAAVPTSLVWMVLAERRPARPHLARWAAAATAALMVLVVSAVVTQTVTWFAAGCAALAGTTASLLGPAIGYRTRNRQVDTAPPRRPAATRTTSTTG